VPNLEDAAAPPVTVWPDNLALFFQELFTAIVRVRSHRQEVNNADVFRSQVIQAIKTADQNAKTRGYTDEDVKSGVFALVAFLDESILNLRKPVFNDWVRKPLQEELFGRHVAGEMFFENLQEILGRRDSPEVADLLEVYYICLLLGYLGRYSISSKGDLRGLMGQTEDKIKRIRKSTVDLSPNWALPAETAGPLRSDPWMRRLFIVAGVCAGIALLLYPVYHFTLSSGVSSLNQLSSRGRP
jgi:type VI secretion system protein ImpK